MEIIRGQLDYSSILHAHTRTQTVRMSMINLFSGHALRYLPTCAKCNVLEYGTEK